MALVAHRKPRLPCFEDDAMGDECAKPAAIFFPQAGPVRFAVPAGTFRFCPQVRRYERK